MSVRHSLRLRFALTFALVGAVLVLIHAVAILQLNRHQEAQLIDQIVSDEMEGLLQQYERIGSIDGPPYRKLQRFDVRADTQALSLRKWFRASWLVHGYATRGIEEQRQLPEELRALDPGFHDITSGADRYRVEVREIGSMRFYLAYSVSLHEERAHAFTIALVLGAVFTALVTALIGLWASGWLTRHVVDLARRVRQLDGRSGESGLEQFYPEREVAELAAAFDGYHARMVALERERAFTADVSHELRTPLTSIQTSCELMLEDRGLSPKARERLEKIDAAAARLADLVNAFLLMAREEADGIRGEVDLRECVEEVAESVRERAVAKGLTLLVDAPESLPLRVPRRALHVVLSNLLANAVSYTERGTVALRTRGGTVEITDTGRGVAPEQIPELFRRFRRGDSLGTGEGFGLGLAIVKRICEQAGWKVSIEPRAGGGTRVLLALI